MEKIYCICLVNLEVFMNKYYFNHFLNQLPNNLTFSSVQLYNSGDSPYCLYIYFTDEDSKAAFLREYQSQPYPSLFKKMEIISDPDPSSLNLLPPTSDEFLIKYDCEYHKMVEMYYEKNQTDDGLVYTDAKALSKQRGSISYIIKKLGAHIMKGESVMNISLPVFMFDERSLLET